MNEEVHEFNFSINNNNDADIMVLSYQKQIKIPYIKLFENFNVSGGIYYIYKPKYAFSSFRVYDYIDHSSRKDSKISNSKIINSEKNFNFNNYYKNLFQNMYMKKSIDNQNDETNKFIHCRYLDNSFKITIINKVTKLKIQKKKETSISTFSYICEDFVSSCCTISSNQFLTGLDNGKLIRWNIIKEDKDKIEISFDKNIQAHRGRINVIEIDQRMGLIITSGKDNLVQIRKLYNLELLTPITIKKKYVITMAKVESVHVNSKRTMKLGEEFYSFEVGYDANVEDLKNEDVDDYIASLYERANALVDDQALETVKSLTPQDED